MCVWTGGRGTLCVCGLVGGAHCVCGLVGGQASGVHAGYHSAQDGATVGSKHQHYLYICTSSCVPLPCHSHQLVQWDVESASCLRDVSSSHPRNACILQVKVGVAPHTSSHTLTTCLTPSSHIPPILWFPSPSPTPPYFPPHPLTPSPTPPYVPLPPTPPCDLLPPPPPLLCPLPSQYTDLYNTALFSDISGSIYSLTFK